MSRYSRTKRFLTRCPMCGSPTYRFYLGTSDQEFICFNCYRIFIQKEKLHPKIVEKKSLQVRQFQKQNHFISRFLSFFFVGFGYLWREQTFQRAPFSLYLFYFHFKICLLEWSDTFSLSPAVLDLLEMDLLGRSFRHFLHPFHSTALSA